MLCLEGQRSSLGVSMAALSKPPESTLESKLIKAARQAEISLPSKLAPSKASAVRNIVNLHELDALADQPPSASKLQACFASQKAMAQRGCGAGAADRARGCGARKGEPAIVRGKQRECYRQSKR